MEIIIVFFLPFQNQAKIVVQNTIPSWINKYLFYHQVIQLEFFALDVKCIKLVKKLKVMSYEKEKVKVKERALFLY